MIGRVRVSWVHLIAFTGGLLLLLGVLVRSTIDRVNQINLVSSQTVMAAADAAAAAVEDPLRAGSPEALQDRVRSMASQHLRMRYRVVGPDGTVLADSQQIQPSGRLESPLITKALADGRAADAAGLRPYEMVAVEPLRSADGGMAAVLVIDASWERQYLALRLAIEREAISAALALLVLVTGAFIAVWRLGVVPLHRLREIADAAAADPAAAVRAPPFRLADLHAIGQGFNRVLDATAAERRLLSGQIGRLSAELDALRRDMVELERERDIAETADAAKSDFLARMSHDLRTPLHGIIGFAEMIRDEMVGPIGTAKYADYARDIHQSGVHLLRLINDVLDLSKIEAGRFELVEDIIAVSAVIEESAHAVSPLAEQKGLVLTVSLAPGLPLLTADEKTLRQMLFNLLSNAIKFTDPGGRVTVTAQMEECGLIIVVADTGVGIEHDDIDLVFTEFGQAGHPRTRPAEGTGLGLVIVKSLIELHGGRLILESEPGIGTAVTLIFPAGRTAGRNALELPQTPDRTTA